MCSFTLCWLSQCVWKVGLGLSMVVSFSYKLCLNLRQFRVLLLKGPENFVAVSGLGNCLSKYQLMTLFLYLVVYGPYDDTGMLFVLCAVMQCIVSPTLYWVLNVSDKH
jgi:hypothetical protein